MTKRKILANSLKVRILRSYLKGEKGIAALAEEYEIKPSQIYNWEKQFFDGGEKAFERKNCRINGVGAVSRQEKQIKDLEEKLTRKNSVISTLMEELILEKKRAGI